MILTRQTLRQFVCTVNKQWQARSLSATLQETEQMVVIDEQDNKVAANATTALKFPGIWLRDNCLCDQCFHKDSLSRMPLRWNNFDCDVKVEKLQVDQKAQQVHINWSDNHESTFPLDWLKEHSFCKERQNEYIDTWYRPKPKPWSKEEFPKILKKFQYKDIMENDEGLRKKFYLRNGGKKLTICFIFL